MRYTVTWHPGPKSMWHVILLIKVPFEGPDNTGHEVNEAIKQFDTQIRTGRQEGASGGGHESENV